MKVRMIFIIIGIFSSQSLHSQINQERGEFPETKYGIRILKLESDLDNFLQNHFGEFEIPELKELAIDMLNYYYRENPPKDHPAYCSADFNTDAIPDHAFILRDRTGSSILAILNGVKDNPSEFEIYVVQGIHGYEDDYLLFRKGELFKGNFEKDGTYINWSDEKATYKSRGH